MTEPETWPAVRAVPRTFFRTPVCSDLDQLDAEIAFIGVPFDQGSGTYRRAGARSGPDGLRNIALVYDYMDAYEDKEGGGFFDIDEQQTFLRGIKMVDCGDVTITASNIDNNFSKITTAVGQILKKDAFPVIIGGDHAITFPCVRAFKEFESLAIVHFDAHLDFSHGAQGVLYSGATPIRRVSELPFVREITSIGVRSAISEKVYWEGQAHGIKVVTTRQFQAMGVEAAVEQVPRSENIYITVDIDVLDPSCAPATGIPVAGGLSFYELRDAMRAVATRGRVVGLDVVEFAPDYDCAQVTARNVATLVRDFLAVLFPSKEPAAEPQ